MEDILLTIRCFAYNHGPYIRQCLDGFVMQRTNFKFQAVVHDDASTDNTADIIREYAEKYPQIIIPILETENKYSKQDGSLGRAVNPYIKGKYIAICEGDDYWTDPYKLQKQVDFLESHPDYVICSHLCQIYKQEENLLGDLFPSDTTTNIIYDLDEFVSRRHWLTQTLTVVYRRSAFKPEIYKKYKNIKDLTLYYHLLKSGKGYFINENMAVYRNHAGGVWTKANHIEKNASDLKTYMGIYQVEQDLISAKALYVRLHEIGYVGITFLKQNMKLYIAVLKIIFKHMGLLATLKSMARSLNIFKIFS